LDFDNGRHCSGMDGSEVPSSGRNRMVADLAPEYANSLHFMFILFTFSVMGYLYWSVVLKY